VGFAPVMVDIVLQAYGWERGWAIWSAIAGHAALVGNGSTFITDEVASGRRALGLTIDFFAASAIASGAPLRFSYPRHGGMNPAHIALLEGAPHRAGGLAFANFVLSEAGQTLLAHPSIRKLPVRPSVYAKLPADQFNPFEAARLGGYDYNAALGQGRLTLVAALFEQMLVAEHGQRAELWRRVHAAEAAGKPGAAAARRALEQAPLTEAQASDPALQARFKRVEGAAPGELSPAEQAWREQAARARLQAQEALA
jgi:phosphoglycerate transport regulatory protein PgtC